MKLDLSPFCGGISEADLRPHSPLRSSATTLIPFLRPSDLTMSSVAGTVKLLRGDTLSIGNNCGVSSGLLTVPTTAIPFKTQGEALSITELIDQLAFLVRGTFEQLRANQTG